MATRCLNIDQGRIKALFRRAQVREFTTHGAQWFRFYVLTYFFVSGTIMQALERINDLEGALADLRLAVCQRRGASKV